MANIYLILFLIFETITSAAIIPIENPFDGNKHDKK